MRVGIIGAGRVGSALAIGLKAKGFEISGIHSASDESVRVLNERLGTCFINDLVLTVKNSELIFLTVSDASLPSVVKEMEKNVKPMDICLKTVLHCSGALSSEVLEVLRGQGVNTGSLHPIQTFADKENGWKGLDDIYFGYEGCIEARKPALEIVEAFNGTMLPVDRENKRLYHAAACIFSNYLVTLTYLAGNVLNNIGIENDTGIKAFMPLIKKTASNIESLGAINALTGPIARGDSETVAGHIRALEENSPGTLEAYKVRCRQ